MDYFLGKTGITRLASDLKTKFTALFAAISHTHNAATDLTGQVPIANGGTGAATQAAAQTALDIAPKDGSAHTVGEIDTNLLGVVSKTGVDAMAVGEDDLRTQIQTLQDSVSAIGTYTYDVQSVSVPNATDVTVCSVSLEAGIWQVSSSGDWGSSFTQDVTLILKRNSTDLMVAKRNTGRNGGDLFMTVTVNAAAAVTVSLSVYQSSGSTQTARGVLRAVRIK